MLCEFFDSMVNSIRLLRLKRLQPTFTKICHIESLIERRFTKHHLAQLKHIVPEIIVVKKIRVQDEETNCMKEEFLILLGTDSMEVHQNKQGKGRFSHQKEMFQSRITTFYATHPEVDEFPEGELPHMFCMKEAESTTKETSNSIVLSHVSSSCKRRFSSRACSASVSKEFSVKTSSCLLKTPVKDTSFTNVEDGGLRSNIKGTPVEAISTPSKLMVATPALCPPKRSLMSPDHDDDEFPTKSAKRRSLTFYENHCDIDDQPILHSLMDKERKILKEQDPLVSQTNKLQKLISGVPKLFDMISLLFQLVGRSAITRQELIHKVIADHLDIIDRGEVEEQLKLLQEIAPEYLSELPGLSGDTLLRLNRLSCLNTIRAKLLEATQQVC